MRKDDQTNDRFWPKRERESRVTLAVGDAVVEEDMTREHWQGALA